MQAKSSFQLKDTAQCLPSWLLVTVSISSEDQGLECLWCTVESDHLTRLATIWSVLAKRPKAETLICVSASYVRMTMERGSLFMTTAWTVKTKRLSRPSNCALSKAVSSTTMNLARLATYASRLYSYQPFFRLTCLLRSRSFTRKSKIPRSQCSSWPSQRNRGSTASSGDL